MNGETPHDAEWLEYDDDTRPSPSQPAREPSEAHVVCKQCGARWMAAQQPRRCRNPECDAGWLDLPMFMDEADADRCASEDAAEPTEILGAEEIEIVRAHCLPLCGPYDTPEGQAADYALQVADSHEALRAAVNANKDIALANQIVTDNLRAALARAEARLAETSATLHDLIGDVYPYVNNVAADPDNAPWRRETAALIVAKMASLLTGSPPSREDTGTEAAE